MLSIAKIEEMLTALQGIEARRVRTRLQYLNLDDFPPGLRVGSANRAEYGLAEAFALAVVFALSNLTLKTSSSRGLVVTFWPELVRRLLLAAARAEEVETDEDPWSSNKATFMADRLGLDFRGDPDPRKAARSFWMALPGSQMRIFSIGSAVVLDIDAIVRSMLEALGGGSQPLCAEALRREIRELALSEGQAEDGRRPADRGEDRPAIAAPGTRGERLCESDYWFGRATEVVRSALDQDHTTPAVARTFLFQRYLRLPARREGWKRWVPVGDSGVHLVDAVEFLVSLVRTRYRHALPTGDDVGPRLRSSGLDDTKTLADAINATIAAASKPAAARNQAPVSATGVARVRRSHRSSPP